MSDSRNTRSTAGSTPHGQTPVRRPGRPTEWTEERLLRELAKISLARGHFPTRAELQACDRRDLASAIKRNGGLALWARRLQEQHGVATKQRGIPRDLLASDVQAIVGRLGVLPPPGRLAEEGFTRLSANIARHPGGRKGLLSDLGYGTEDIQRLLVPLAPRKPWTRGDVERELRLVQAERTDWPPRRWFLDTGRGRLLNTVRRFGGERAWADALGFRWPR